MTDNVLQKLEEKVMTLLTELESLRKDLGQLRHENTNLKADKANYTKKLQSLISLLDSLDITDEVGQESELPAYHTHDEFATA